MLQTHAWYAGITRAELIGRTSFSCNYRNLIPEALRTGMCRPFPLASTHRPIRRALRAGYSEQDHPSGSAGNRLLAGRYPEPTERVNRPKPAGEGGYRHSKTLGSFGLRPVRLVLLD